MNEVLIKYIRPFVDGEFVVMRGCFHIFDEESVDPYQQEQCNRGCIYVYIYIYIYIYV